MKVLVAGAAGFLGSHLTDALLARGDSVIGVDDLTTGSLMNLEHAKTHPDFEFVERDIADDLAMATKFDLIFNLASPASPKAYMNRPIETLRTGSVGTRQLLDRADRDGARFLMASTSEIYGEPLVHPQSETYWGNVNPIGVRSVYDEAKRFSEALTFAYHRAHETQTTVVRIFNTYGPRLAPGDGRVVSNFIVQALHNEPLTVYGDGSQTRSLCYVDDLVRGLIAAAESGKTGPFNLGQPREMTILDLASMIIDMTASTSTLVHHDLPFDDPSRRQPDISLAKNELGWTPRVDLEAGLTETISYFRALA